MGIHEDMRKAFEMIRDEPLKPRTGPKLFDYCDYDKQVVETYGTGICPGCLRKTRKRLGEGLL